jgi:acyl-coenzyme A thioesterase PaaI-like protein
MGLSCALQVPEGSAPLTVSLSVDYLGVAKPGQWLEVDTTFVRPGGTLCFAQAFVTADGVACARANATFRVVTR